MTAGETPGGRRGRSRARHQRVQRHVEETHSGSGTCEGNRKAGSGASEAKRRRRFVELWSETVRAHGTCGGRPSGLPEQRNKTRCGPWRWPMEAAGLWSKPAETSPCGKAGRRRLRGALKN